MLFSQQICSYTVFRFTTTVLGSGQTIHLMPHNPAGFPLALSSVYLFWNPAYIFKSTGINIIFIETVQIVLRDEVIVTKNLMWQEIEGNFRRN